MNDIGFKVAGHLRHKGAIPSPPAWIVVKHHKQARQNEGSECKTCQFRPCFLKRARSKKQERYPLRRGAVLKAVVEVFFAAS